MFKADFKLGTKQSPNFLKIAVRSDISTMNLSANNKGSYSNSSVVIPWVFEGLLRRGEGDVPRPAIAHKVDVSPDQMRYIFHLRDCTWSDGVPITAQDFEYAWKRQIDPHSPALIPVPELVTSIKNAKKCLTGGCGIEEVGISVIDDKTLSVELEYPAQCFLDIVASPFFVPAPRHFAEKDPTAWATRENFVCNGPFLVSKWKKNSELVFVKNHHYWDKEHVYLDGIQAYILPHYQTVLHMFEKGELDWAGSPFITIPSDCSEPILNGVMADAMTFFFACNNDKYPLNNRELRKALSYAMDRAAIVENVFCNYAHPSTSVLPISLRLRNTPLFKDNNIPEAKNLLNKALESLGESSETLPAIELLYQSDAEFCKQTCLAVQDHWKKNLGINIILRGVLGRNEFVDTLKRGEYQISMTGVLPTIFDARFVFSSFHTKTDLCNTSNWEDTTFQNLIERSNHSIGDIERTKHLLEAEDVLMDQMPVLPICSPKKLYAKNPKVKGELVSYLRFVDFKSAYFEK